jgi:hypothetical protein
VSRGPISGSAAHPDSSTPVYPGAAPLTAERAARLAADPHRQRLIEQMLAATTKEEIAAARRGQSAWLDENPDDFGVLEAGEAVSYAEEALSGDEPTGRPVIPASSPSDR